MADITTHTYELQAKLKLQRGENANLEETTRTLTIANPDSSGEDFFDDMMAFRTSLMTGALSGVIQPASWRDTDDEEEEFKCVDVEFTNVTTSKTTYDLTT